jgi:hypothetical protein
MSKVMASYISDGEGGADPHPLPTRCDACWVLPLCSRLGEFSTPVHGELGQGVSLGLPIQCGDHGVRAAARRCYPYTLLPDGTL